MAMYNEITVTAELTNTEYMITKNYNLLQNKPQINSVELMGNKSLEDLGINPDAEENVIDVVKVNGSALTPDANKAVNVTVTTGADNGTVKVNGSDVAVKGLKSAAFTEATAYDAAGSAAEVQNNLDNLTVVVNGKVDKVQGKGLSQNDFTNAYKSKLDGIEAGAQVNAVTSVAGKTGAVTLQKSDVGLGNVDNTSDLNKPISTATQTALNGKVDKETGKGLSTNDYTTAEKNKLAGIAEGATAVSISDTLAEGDTLANITINGTTTTIKGGSGSGAVDDELSPTSINPVQNKVIYETLNNLLPEATASGNPISIDNASGFNAKSAKVTMLPIQDLHGQEAPYPAGGGKNKLNAPDVTLAGGGYIYNDTCDIKVGTYTISFNGSTSASIAFYDSDGNALVSGSYNVPWTFTLTDDAKSAKIYVPSAGTYTEIMVEQGSTKTSYAPYSNICPISGRDSVDLVDSGKNILDIQHETIKKWRLTSNVFTSYSDSNTNIVFSISDDDISIAVDTAFFGIGFNIESCPVERTYSIISSKLPYGIYLYSSYTTGATSILSSREHYLTIPANMGGFLALLYTTTFSSTIANMQIELGSTATEYEPYSAETYTATFPSTVYGGEYEFVEGGLKENYGIVDLGTLTWSGSNGAFSALLSTMKSGATNVVPLLCDIYKQDEASVEYSVRSASRYVGVNDPRFTTAAAFKTAMSGIQLAYELATPTTTTLTPQSISLNKGDNVITTDGDNAGVKYSVSLDSLLPT